MKSNLCELYKCCDVFLKFNKLYSEVEKICENCSQVEVCRTYDFNNETKSEHHVHVYYIHGMNNITVFFVCISCNCVIICNDKNVFEIVSNS